jgi:hypothetical protein
MSFQHALDRLMVAVKGRRIEPPIHLAAATILAKLDDMAGHDDLPNSRRCSANQPRCHAIAFML